MKGKVHATASIALAVPCAVAATLYTSDLLAGIGAGMGCLAGSVISPDLDQESISHGEWQIVKRTYGMGFLFLMWWYPYALAHKHRGISHLPIVGTLGRVIYLLAPFLILALVLGADPTTIPEPVRWAAMWAFWGLAVSDGAHFLMDWLTV